MLLLNKSISFNKNETIENEKSFTHFWRDEPCATVHLRIKNQKQNCDELELFKKKENIFCNNYVV